MKLALKVDAATYRGTLVGVPRLVEALRQARANRIGVGRLLE